MRSSRAICAILERSTHAFVVIAALAAGALVAQPAAADFYDGLTAYEGRDFQTAARELEPLARQGDPRAQRLVGFMFRDGQGVPQDFVQAHMWLNLAAASGQEDAAAAREALSQRMTPDQIAEAQRLAAAWRPGQVEAAAAPAYAPPSPGPAAPAQPARPLTRAQITDLQWQLAVHGYDPGPADGVVGPRTRSAIRRYQADADLAVDGEPSLALLDHLQFTDPPVRAQAAAPTYQTPPASAPSYEPRTYDTPSYGTPSYGSPPPSVGAPAPLLPEQAAGVGGAEGLMQVYVLSVQEELAARGYRPGPIDGVLGPRTRSAIRRYQAEHGLPIDGEVSLELVNHLRLISG
jgi:localization factor PodJL